MDLLRARAAVLAGHQVEDGGARPAGAEAGLAEGALGVLAPGADGCHPEDDSDSHRRATVPGVKTRIVLSLIAGATLAGCGSSSGSAGTTVVAAFYPLAFAAEQIGGDGIEVANLTPPGVEPHDLELSGSDVRPSPMRDLVLYLGHGFQPRSRRRSTDERATRSTSSRLAPRRAKDPHVWLDPVRYAEIVERIGEELDRRPEAERFAAQLRVLDREFRRGLAHCERHEIVTSHAAFGYLAERYGLEQIAITGIAPEAEPTPRELEDVVRQGASGRRHDGLLRDPRVAPARGDRRARDRRADGRARPARGPDEEEVARGRGLLLAHAREPRGAAAGARMPLAVELRDVSFAYDGAVRAARRRTSPSKRASSSRSPARTAAARPRCCGSRSGSSGRRRGEAAPLRRAGGEILAAAPRSATSPSARSSGSTRPRPCARSSPPAGSRRAACSARCAAATARSSTRRSSASGSRSSADVPLRTLSGGQQQRAFIAKALAGRAVAARPGRADGRRRRRGAGGARRRCSTAFTASSA